MKQKKFITCVEYLESEARIWKS